MKEVSSQQAHCLQLLLLPAIRSQSCCYLRHRASILVIPRSTCGLPSTGACFASPAPGETAGAALGLVLPRRADEQARSSSLLTVQRAELKPGDLVFFNTMRRTFSHVGIYIGDNKFIHSPRSGSEVRVEDMRLGYWQTRFNGARRVQASDSQP